jgi:hypothetical protein
MQQSPPGFEHALVPKMAIWRFATDHMESISQRPLADAARFTKKPDVQGLA